MEKKLPSSSKICNTPLESECTNFGLFEYNICNDCKSELDCFHDVIFDANGKDLNYRELSEEFLKLSEDLKLLSKDWGLCDTEFRGKIFDLYEEKNKEQINVKSDNSDYHTKILQVSMTEEDKDEINRIAKIYLKFPLLISENEYGYKARCHVKELGSNLFGLGREYGKYLVNK